MQKITPFLWFDNQAEEAANHYVSIFGNSRILKTVRYGESGPGPKGAVMTVSFEINGQQFTALNGGPKFGFSEAISFVVSCETQAEIDSLWERLSAGGKESRCGWLKDRYGLSWQLVPTVLPELLGDKDSARAQRAMQAMLKMGKLDIAALKRAHQGAA
jgi:predicted 3-demethylubiquinone-9 3-methyltransferase (glyoxalase superfamily)